MNATRQIGFILLLIAGALLFYASQSWLTPLMIALAGLAGLTGKRELNISDARRLIYLLAVVLFFAMKYRFFMPLAETRRMIFLGHPIWLAASECFLALAAAYFYIPSPKYGLSLRGPYFGFLSLLCAGMRMSGYLPMGAFHFAAMLYIVGLACFYWSLRRYEDTANPRQIQRRIAATLLIVGAAVTFAWLSGKIWGRYEHNLDTLISRLGFSVQPNFARRWAGMEFPGDIRLGSVNNMRISQGDQAALRIFSNFPPGYLRAAVYEKYSESRWQTESTSVKIQPGGKLPANLHFSGRDPVFVVNGDQSKDWRILDVWPDPKLTAALCAPFGVAAIQVSVPNVVKYENDILDSDELAGGVNYFEALPLDKTGQSPTEDYLRKCLIVPVELAETIKPLADQIFTPSQSPAEKMSAVTHYFQKNYTYQLGVQIPREQDPLTYFLLQKPAAHCEYFASGAAILLRLAGVPARYVAGFVAVEKNPYADYWLARYRDAHAWVEAWDSQNQQWVLVEATAGGGVPTDRAAGSFDYGLDALKYYFQNFRVVLYRDGFKGLIRLIGKALISAPGLIFVGIIVVIIVRRRMIRSLRGRKNTRSLEPQIVTLQQWLRNLDRNVKKYKLIRRPNETLHQFADRLEKTIETGEQQNLKLAAGWYRRYADLRYRPNISAEDIQKLKDEYPRNLSAKSKTDNPAS